MKCNYTKNMRNLQTINMMKLQVSSTLYDMKILISSVMEIELNKRNIVFL
jgi:hypothetical protein